MSVTSLLYELKEKKEQYEKSVIQNGVRDWAHYKFLVGHIAGFESAIEICRNVFKGEIND
jgi:hypothetical protein